MPCFGSKPLPSIKKKDACLHLKCIFIYKIVYLLGQQLCWFTAPRVPAMLLSTTAVPPAHGTESLLFISFGFGVCGPPAAQPRTSEEKNNQDLSSHAS